MVKKDWGIEHLLLFSVFVIATCGLIYELIAGALASYLLGDSITQFSTVIGTYLFAMGIGSYFSRFFEKNLISSFIRLELLIGLIGGFSASFLFLVFEYVSAFRFLLYSEVLVTGILVGLEIPLLMNILKESFEFKELVSKIFTFDYIGALFASILFPLVLIPRLGLVRTSFLFGIINCLVALWTIYVFRKELKSLISLYTLGVVILFCLIMGFILSDEIVRFSESSTYSGTIIYTKNSPYQRIVITRKNKDVQMYLNGNLQFNTFDEYRYHESLVHQGLCRTKNPKRVLVLGGGDGMAVREILKYPEVDSVLLVDLDPAITGLFSNTSNLAALNDFSLLNSKVRVLNEDAFNWIRSTNLKFDFVVVDFPDPVNFSIGKLYTQRFYHHLKSILKEDGIAAIQSTSPLVATKSFWSIHNTVQSVGLNTHPYFCYVPSFGEWGFLLASKKDFPSPGPLPNGLKYLNTPMLDLNSKFPQDMEKEDVEINKLNNQVLVRYFEEEWSKVSS